MRLFGRHDLVLATGLTIALLVVFSGPVASLLDYAQALEARHGLRLLPALVILAFVFMFQQLWKRQEMRAKSLAAHAAAREATERAADMTRLVALGHALARSLDPESIKAAASAHLPLLVPGRAIWAMLQVRSNWTPLVVVGDSSAAERETAAAHAIVDGNSGAVKGGDICFPMMVADKPIGALGVASQPPLSPHQHNMIAAAAALLAVSLKNAELFNEVRENSVRDALTGCFNRAYALDALDTELRRRRRSQTPLSVVMFDLDRFKAINDGHGHLCGDAVLASVAARLKAVLRGGDVKCRYGGEEFLILLPDTPLAGARHVAETLRRDIEEHPVRWREETVHVTASFGVTTARAGDADALTLVARVDGALYVAKHTGRNCVRLAEEDTADGGPPAPGVYDEPEAEGQRVNTTA